jgi:hypothetical protein
MRNTFFAVMLLAASASSTAHAQTVVFHEDFESGLGAWTATGLWNWELDTDPCGATQAPFPAGSGAAYFGIDGACNYDLGPVTPRGSLVLLEPVLIPAGGVRAMLRFRYVLAMEFWDEDQCWDYADASVGPGSPLWQGCYLGSPTPPAPGWHDAELDITALVGQSVRPRFIAGATDSMFNSTLGWLIDDVRIELEAGFPICGAPCPCGNEVGTPLFDRTVGCENSRGTGAVLAGGGAPSVSADTLTLTARGMPPTTTALLVQGPLEQGAPFGHGRLCVGGAIRRLLARGAVDGVAAFPGSVPHGIATLGAVPPAGGMRVYQVFYRDQAPGHCNPERFNLSNGYRIGWTP